MREAEIADGLLAVLGTGRSVERFGGRYPEFDLAGAYAVTDRVRALRAARGEAPVGRKIGFTNTTIWAEYGVSGPLWNYMFTSTVHDLAAIGGRFSLAGLAEPRIEPEIVLHLGRAPEPGMAEDALFGCVDWVAHGFEIVQCVFPRWEFTAAEATAAFGLHGALLLGPRHDVTGDRQGWQAALGRFSIGMDRDGALAADGHARNVLGGPLSALRFLVETLDRDPDAAALAPGEIVTTGTLTRALPVEPGAVWTTRLDGIGIGGIRVELI